MVEDASAKYVELREGIVKLETRMNSVECTIQEIKDNVQQIQRDLGDIKATLSSVTIAQYYQGKNLNTLKNLVNEETGSLRKFLYDVVKLTLAAVLAVAGSHYVF